jgi:hypothetical protein
MPRKNGTLVPWEATSTFRLQQESGSATDLKRRDVPKDFKWAKI